MNEELQNALVILLNKAVTGVDSGVAFMEAQLPEVVEQVLTWHLVYSAILVPIGLMIICAFIYLVYKALTADKRNTFWFEFRPEFGDYIKTDRGVQLLTGGFLFNCVGVVFVWKIFTVLQILIAPKLWLAEYAASLVK